MGKSLLENGRWSKDGKWKAIFKLNFYRKDGQLVLRGSIPNSLVSSKCQKQIFTSGQNMLKEFEEAAQKLGKLS